MGYSKGSTIFSCSNGCSNGVSSSHSQACKVLLIAAMGWALQLEVGCWIDGPWSLDRQFLIKSSCVDGLTVFSLSIDIVAIRWLLVLHVEGCSQEIRSLQYRPSGFDASDARHQVRHQRSLTVHQIHSSTPEQNTKHKTRGWELLQIPQTYTSIMPDRFNPAAALRPVKSVVSASFLYPFKGVYYYLAHPAFYPLFGRRLIPLIVTSIVVLGLLFTFTYLPQVAFLAIFHGHLAWFNAAFLVLGEGQVVIALLFEALLVDETLVNVFDVCTPTQVPQAFTNSARRSSSMKA